DTVISCETIEHVPDPSRAVAELAQVLKPGGRLFLTTPNYFGPFGLYRAYLRLRRRRFTEVGQPINQLTLLPRTLRWIRRAGLIAKEVADRAITSCCRAGSLATSNGWISRFSNGLQCTVSWLHRNLASRESLC